MEVLDLFSGIGGFSLGLERAGMKTTAFCEIDPYCREVLKKHWPGILKFKDIEYLQPKKGDYDLICGGFPCQDISVAGKKEGIDGNRSGLWKEFYRIIKEVSPRWVIIENVANLRNLGLAQVIKDLWKIGYVGEWHIISARSIGACHLRERVWIIAYPDRNPILQQQGWSSRSSREDTVQFGTIGEEGRAQTSNANMPRLWRPFATEEEKQKWWAKTTACFRDWWEAEPSIGRVDDGLSGGLDKNRRERIKALGNSIVPQIAELIGKEIMKYEDTK